jgi:hypothetical protein
MITLTSIYFDKVRYDSQKRTLYKDSVEPNLYNVSAWFSQDNNVMHLRGTILYGSVDFKRYEDSFSKKWMPDDSEWKYEPVGFIKKCLELNRGDTWFIHTN